MNKKDITILVLIVAIGIGVVYGLSSNTDEGPTKSALNDDELSGKIVKSDLAMAGAPCHYMANQWMGDCIVREIEFEAWRYDWSEPTITVKTGELVRIKATTRDVAHGVAIPEIGFNLVISPGKESVGEFLAPAPGEYLYGCSVMCGPGHHDHTGKLVVVA